MSRPHIPSERRQQVIEDAGTVCGYCLSEEVLMGISLTFEHIVPIASGGLTIRENLWRSCRSCNEFKSARLHAADPETGEFISLFHPRSQNWTDHFRWTENYARIVGVTATGRATVEALQLNRSLLIKARRRWRMMGWIPVSDDERIS